jgi:hypothetical protein
MTMRVAVRQPSRKAARRAWALELWARAERESARLESPAPIGQILPIIVRAAEVARARRAALR